MFYHISGELVAVESNIAVIDCNGVGYCLTVSANTQSKLHTPGQKIKLFTHFAVREDNVELYGFYTLEERDTFRLLIDVSGVGPKAAINVLSAFTPEGLATAVFNGDTKLISKAQNVGAKTAARIVLELKDKIGKSIGVSEARDAAIPSVLPINSEKQKEAANALAVLGYRNVEINAALKNIDTANLELEDIIREALKRLMK